MALSRHRKTWYFRATALLAAGMVINLMVAMGAALFSECAPSQRTQGAVPNWCVESTLLVTHPRFRYETTSETAVLDIRHQWGSIRSTRGRGPGVRYDATAVRCGFPYRSLAWYGVERNVYDHELGIGSALVFTGIAVPHLPGFNFVNAPNPLRYNWAGGTAIPRRVPTSVLAWGTVANTAIYAMLVGCAYGLVRHIRRSRRIAKGRCVSCGYSLEGLLAGVCPECGRRTSS